MIAAKRWPRLAMLLVGGAFVITAVGGILEYVLAGSAARQVAAPLAHEVSAQLAAQQLRMALARDSALRHEQVRVAATEHTIELSGTCSSPAARELVRRYADQTGRGQDTPPTIIDNLQLAGK